MPVNGVDDDVLLSSVRELADDVLRRMNHRQWLLQFAQVLSVSPNAPPTTLGGNRYQGLPMTPFRAGAVTRLSQAAQYIDLLERDLAAVARRVDELTKKLGKMDKGESDGR